MTIRRLHEGDEEVAVRVVEDLKFRMDEVVGVTVDPEYMRTFLADDRHYFIIAYIEDEPAGYVFGYRLARFDGIRPQVLLFEIGVMEQHRRRGIGRALIENLKATAKADGCWKMSVPTSRSNEAAMAVLSRNSSVPQSALKAGSQAVDICKGAPERQDSTYSETKGIAQEPRIGLLERTGGPTVYER